MSRREGFSYWSLSSLHSGHKTRKENVAPGWSSGAHLSNPGSSSPEKHNEPPIPRLASSSMDLDLSINTIITARNSHMKTPAQREVGFTKDEWDYIHRCFPAATCIQYSYPFFVICGTTPPVDPISIKGLIVEFYDDIEEFKYCPGLGGNPTVPDPLPRWPKPYQKFDGFESIQNVCVELSSKLGIPIYSITTYLHLLVIEVHSSNYDLAILPGKVGGRIAMWSVYGETWGKPFSDVPRMKDPACRSGDNTDYVFDGLCPGIKVCGHTMSTSSGALLKNLDTGEEVITVANHGWLSDEGIVFHPDIYQAIGTINKRNPNEDVALCTLRPNILYTNAKYFSAPPPIKLVTGKHVEDYIAPFSFFAADGFTSGACWMQVTGFRHFNGIPSIQLSSQNAYIMRMLRASSREIAMAVEGICGAPVVHQEDDDDNVSNVCLGFFYQFDGNNALVPTVDFLIADGWQIS